MLRWDLRRGLGGNRPRSRRASEESEGELTLSGGVGGRVGCACGRQTETPVGLACRFTTCEEETEQIIRPATGKQWKVIGTG
jgi:hypothetical protein